MRKIPAKIQDLNSVDPLVRYHKGELWLAFSVTEKDGRAIWIIHSPDGVEWSSPIALVKEAPGDCSFPYSIQWLKRPDGTLWFLWTSGKNRIT